MAQQFLTNIDLNQNSLFNAAIGAPVSQPASPVTGEVYYDSTANTILFWNGTAWIDIAGDISEVATPSGSGLSGGTTSGTATLSLTNTGVTANTYGSGTEIPVITIDAQGRITLASTANVATDLTIDADGPTTADVSLLTDDLQILGDTGITTSVSKTGTDVQVLIDLDDTSVSVGSYGTAAAVSTFTVDQQGRLTAAGQTTIDISSAQINDLSTTLVSSVTGTANEIEVTGTGSGPYTGDITVGLPNDVTIGNNLTVTNDLTVTGDLIVNGNTTTVNTATLSVEDPLIILGNGNDSTDSVDIGFYGLYDTSGSQDLYAGLFRDADAGGKFKLFVDLQTAPTTTVDTAGAGYTIGTLVANIEGGTVSGLTTDLAIADGGTSSSTSDAARVALAADTGGATLLADARLARIASSTLTAGATTYTVTHNFDDEIIVQVYNSTGDTVITDVTRGSGTVTIGFAATTTADYTVVITG